MRVAALVAELERAGYASAARCLADDLDALVVHLRYPHRYRKRGARPACATGRSAR
jgi:hypothetical protein